MKTTVEVYLKHEGNDNLDKNIYMSKIKTEPDVKKRDNNDQIQIVIIQA